MKNDKTIFTIALAVLLTLSAYFLADTVDAVIGRSLDAAPRFTTPLEQARPGIEPRRELSDYNSILERGLFGDGKGPSGGTAASEPSAFVLVGTVEGESFAGAVLQDAANVQTFYRRNEKLPDGSRIIKVLRDKITIKREGGGTFDLQVVDDTRIVSVSKPGMPAPGGVRKVSEGKWMVDQQTVAASTENLSQILSQARALPYMEQGKTVGFRISEIAPGSLYERIGLQNGDVIQRINSQDVDDPGKFFQFYQGLKEEKSIIIDLMRGGQRQTLNYEIR
jgi:general secretion pathway protein C